MVDHHVDRPGVDERQRLKLTGTNRPIGLIIPIRQCSPRKARVNIGFCWPLTPTLHGRVVCVGRGLPWQSDGLSSYGRHVLKWYNRNCSHSIQTASLQRPSRTYANTAAFPKGAPLGSPTGRRAFWPAPAETVGSLPDWREPSETKPASTCHLLTWWF